MNDTQFPEVTLYYDLNQLSPELIADRCKTLQSFEIIYYDRSLPTLITVIACILTQTSCLILNRDWPNTTNDRLCAHLDGFDTNSIQPSVFLATSGSTGESKLCQQTYESMLDSAIRSMTFMPIKTDDSFILALQPYHMGGLLSMIKPLMAGASLFAGLGHWSEWIGQPRLHLALVPTQLKVIFDSLKKQTIRLSDIQSILVGGDCLTSPLIDECLRFDLPVIVSYGMSETAGQVFSCFLKQDPKATIGAPLSNVLYKIDPSGELTLKSPTLAVGYVSNGALQPLNFDSDGWFKTGDLVELDSNKQLSFVGRIDFQFQSGGETVCPEVIETVILKSGLVKQVMVIAMPDDTLGQVPVAVVDTDQSFDVIRQFIANQLPVYLQPKSWVLWPKILQDSNECDRLTMASHIF
jgi:O-succinylbenzoic acid--CoA ligase